MKHSHNLWTRCCSLMLLLAGFLVSAGAWAGGVEIDSASWDSSYHPNELYIRGSGEDGSEISIYDADSDVLIDKVRASERGSWRYTASNPSSIPCRVRAESRGERDTRSVANADSFPGGCGTDGGGTPPPSTGLPNQTDFKMLMNYELGMHCTGFEFAYCCVLPVYNSILAQVVKPEGGSNDFPLLLEGDPNANVASILAGGSGDVLGRETVLRDPSLDNNGNFKKYVLRYWHEAQPRVGAGKNGNVQDVNRKISNVELNSLLAWNTVADAADLNPDGSFKLSGAPVHPDDPACVPDPAAVPPGSACLNTHPLYNGAKGVVLGNGLYDDRDDVFTSGAAGAVVDTPIDNYQNAVWNHLYVYNVSAAGVEGQRLCKANSAVGCFTDQDCTDAGAGNFCGDSTDENKVRLGLNMGYPTNFGPGGHAMEGLLTFSGEHGTVVYTQMKVLENLPITLTSPRIWEALGLPLTPFEDSINFFNDPGMIDEDLIRPYVEMKAQLYHADCDGAGTCTEGAMVMDSNDNPVIGFGTAPIDIPNCERCHSVLGSPNSPNPGCDVEVDPTSDSCLVLEEMAFWNAYYDIDTGNGDSDWYSRLKGAAISILARHDTEHGTDFTAVYPAAGCTDVTDCKKTFYVEPGNPGAANPLPQNTRLGHESVICQKCHADNVIAVVKSAFCGPGSECSVTAADQLFENITGNDISTGAGHLIPPLTEALHYNHRSVSEGGQIAFNDSKGRSGGCQGCHPAHRSDGVMDGYPIDDLGGNAYAAVDNRDANGGCFVGRDVHSNPLKDHDGAETPEHLNAVGQWLSVNVFDDNESVNGGIWCTNCHQQLGQELWKAEDMEDLVHGVGIRNVREPAPLTGEVDDDLDEVLAGLGIDSKLGRSWLDPKGHPSDDTTKPIASADGVDHTHAIWAPDPGICSHVASALSGGTIAPDPAQDGNVATIEVAIGSVNGTECSTGIGLPGPNCGLVPDGVIPGGADFFICGSLDGDSDVSVSLVTIGNTSKDGTGDECVPGVDTPCFAQSSPFCTTSDCVTDAQSYLNALGHGTTAFPVPMSAATDGRDHWLAPGEPHCADCHAAPYVEQSGNINAFAPFNYPRKASLMRYSRGHQDITCQGCHESIHGLYPVTPDIDTTSYAQAASLNHDGSHGPLKCGACHEVGSDQLPRSIDDLEYNGQRIRSIDDPLERFDAAVSWAHTFTVEHDPTQDYCVNCHEDESHEVSWREEEWLEHSMKGRVPRKIMDRVELQEQGFISGDPAAEQDPLRTVCQGCHSDESDEISCRGEDGREWKEHLIEGRVSEKVWVYVSENSPRTGNTTCGW